MNMRERVRRATSLCPAFFFVVIAGCDQTLGTSAMTDVLPVVTIPGTPFPIDLGLSLGIAIDSEAIDVEADSRFLTSARVRNLELNILNASDNDAREDGAEDSFDFLSGLSIAIRADLNGIVDERLLAFLPDGDPQFGTAARSLVLSVVDFDVLDYLQADNGYELVLQITGQVPPDNIILSGTVRYRVGVGLGL